MRYFVAVFTANIKNAGTNAKAGLTLYGSQGDSGRRPLVDARTHDVKFVQGQVDIFTVESVHLGKLEKVELEHDGTDKGKISQFSLKKPLT